MKKIQVLGTGCPKCKKLTEDVERAAKELGIAYELEKVTDINQILNAGIVGTPALVVDGVLKSVGRLPGLEELKKMISGQ